MEQLKTIRDKFALNCDRLKEIADLCEKENRDTTEAEELEVKAIERDNKIMGMQLQASVANNFAPQVIDNDKALRDCMRDRRECKFVLTRSVQTTAALADTGIIPVQQKEMLAPLRAGLIWDKVGIPIATGLVGKLRWPAHGKATASWADEGARLTDSSISFSKLEMTGERLGVAIPVTREELYDSEGIVEQVIREEMPAAIIDKINDALFTTESTYVDENSQTKTKTVVGPLVAAMATALTFASETTPTRKELLKLKSKVLGSGIKVKAPCWVMTEAMKAILEDVKVDAGSGRFLCENDHILGYPVFCTPSIGEANIAFGDWSYQAAGFFGPIEVMVDPYTLARNHATDFVLNARFGTCTLREDAFAVGKLKPASN